MAKPLIIDNWQKGIAPSPHTGFSRIVNCDISSSTGGLKVNRKTIKRSASVVTGRIISMVRDPDTPANIFALDSDGVVYKSTNSGTSWAELSDRGGEGRGLTIQWGYLFIAQNTTMDLIKISDSTVTNNWGGLTMDSDDLWHPMLVSKNDGKIYGGAANYIFTIEQVAGQTFDPANAATYTATAQALTLPENYRVKCLSELGNNLMIGTWRGANVQDFRIADIFPWDGNAPTYGQPIELVENGVHALITVQNTLYIFAGITGAVYASNGYSATKIAQIPESIVSVTTDTAGGLFEYFPNSVMSQREKIYFGIKNGVEIVGVYSIDLKTGVLVVENTVTVGTGATELSISALLPISYVDYLIAWDSNASSYGIDGTIQKYTAFASYAESALFQVATKKQTISYTQVEWLLSKPLATGQGIQIKYRKNLTDSWTTIREYLYSGTADADTKIVSDARSFNDLYNICDVETIQIRVELTTPGTGDDTPELLNIRLI